MPKYPQPNLESKRLLLRSFKPGDAEPVQVLAGDIRVAKQTMNIPHPYNDGVAEKWISTLESKWKHDERADFAIIIKDTQQLIGSVSFVEINGDMAELGYWIGYPYWGKGFCSEAAKSLVEFGASNLFLSTIMARHLETNPNSGKVLEKLGMIKVKNEMGMNRYGKTVGFVFYEMSGN
ncbi:MAG: GNAT family N-acetyltransferase [bacterium]